MYFLLGILISLDGTMNIYLQQCEEYINGQLSNRFADIFIRGNNGRIFLFNFLSVLYKLFHTEQSEQLKVVV